MTQYALQAGVPKTIYQSIDISETENLSNACNCTNTSHNHSHPGRIAITYDRLLFAFHCGRYCLCCSSDEEEGMSKTAASP